MANNKTLSERIVDSAGTGKSDPTELTVLDDITASAAEINILDGVTATTAEINTLAAATRVVVIPDATPYTVLAANSGKTHIISEQTSSITINLPAVATAGLEFNFILGGVATEAQNWIFVATTPEFWNGGVLWVDLNAGAAADEAGVVYGNGSSHLTFTVVTPAAGTVLKAISNGTEWVISGTVVSDTTPAFT